jgi:putative FmdB family regulatory protein
MPFYDLKCKDCGEEFNANAKISEREQKLIKCPKCAGTEHEAVFKSVNIVQSRKSEQPACPNAHVCGGCCNH